MAWPTPAWDLAAFRLLNQDWRHPVLDLLLPVFSWTWLLWGLVLVAAVVLVRARGWRTLGPVMVLAVAVALANTSCDVLKQAVGRVRPYNALAQVWYQDDGDWRQRPAEFVATDTRGSSFPSGHATNAMAAVTIALLAWPRVRPWAVLIPLLTGWSRIYLGKHYPLDVLAGWSLGLVVAGAVWAGWQWRQRRLTSRGTPAPRPAPGAGSGG